MTMRVYLRKARKLLSLAKPKSEFNAVDATQTLEFLNHRPMPPNSFKVLFMGDSLMMHGSSKGLWDNCCGMAASSPEKDFVHRIVQGVQSSMDRPVEALYNNGGNGTIVQMLAYARRIPLEPDLVILQGGENDEFNDAFRSTYRALLDFYPVPYAVIGDLWSEEKSNFSQQESMARSYPFVNLRAINQDPSNSGDGGPYAHAGVAQHPNDKGMACIARNVLEKLR